MATQDTLEEAIGLFTTQSFEGKPDFVVFLEEFIKNPESLELFCKTIIEPKAEESRKFLIVQFKTFFSNHEEVFIDNESKFIKEEFSPHFQALLEFLIASLHELLNTNFKSSDEIVQLTSIIDILCAKLDFNIFELDAELFVVLCHLFLDRHNEQLEEEFYGSMIQKIADSLPFFDSLGLDYRTAYFGVCIAKELDHYDGENPGLVAAIAEIFKRIEPAFFHTCNRSLNEFSQQWKYLSFSVDKIKNQRILSCEIKKFANYVQLQPQYLINFLIPYENALCLGELSQESFLDKFTFAFGATARFLKENETWDQQCFTCAEFFLSDALIGYDQSTVIELIIQNIEKANESEEPSNIIIASEVYGLVYALSVVPEYLDKYSECLTGSIEQLIQAEDDNLLYVGILCIETLLRSSPPSAKLLSEIIVYIFENFNFELSRDTIVEFCITLPIVSIWHFCGETGNFIDKIKSLIEDVNEDTVDAIIVMSQFTIVTNKGMTQEDVEFLMQLVRELYANGDIDVKAKCLYLAVNLCEILETTGLEFITELITDFTGAVTQEIEEYSAEHDSLFKCLFYLTTDLIKIYAANIIEALKPLLDFIVTVLQTLTVDSQIMPDYLDYVESLHKMIELELPENAKAIVDALISSNDQDAVLFYSKIVESYPDAFPIEQVHEMFSHWIEECECVPAACLLRPEFLGEAVSFVVESCIPNFYRFKGITTLIEKIATISKESLDPLFTPLLVMFAESDLSTKVRALNSFIHAMLNETVSKEIVQQYGAMLIEHLQADDDCIQAALELFAVAGMKIGGEILAETQCLTDFVSSLDDSRSSDVIYEYAAIYELALSKAVIDSGSTEVPGNILALLPSITFTHIYDEITIPLIIELSHQPPLSVVCSRLLAKALAMPPSLIVAKDFSTEFIVNLSKRVTELQQNEELKAVINEEAGQYLTLMNERQRVAQATA